MRYKKYKKTVNVCMDVSLFLQIRSKNIMASLEETKVPFTKDEETNGLKCNVCNVCLNSIQQLQTHLNGISRTEICFRSPCICDIKWIRYSFFLGSRHKKKAMRGNKPYMVRKSLPYGFRCSRTICMDKIIEKNVVVLIYCLLLFTFACLTLLLTFAFHLFLWTNANVAAWCLKALIHRLLLKRLAMYSYLL